MKSLEDLYESLQEEYRILNEKYESLKEKYEALKEKYEPPKEKSIAKPRRFIPSFSDLWKKRTQTKLGGSRTSTKLKRKTRRAQK
jgi:predicted nuclease with TOPRIM domain